MNSSFSSVHVRILAPTLLVAAGLMGCLTLVGCGEDKTPPANPPAGAQVHPIDAPKSTHTHDHHAANAKAHDMHATPMASDVNSQAKGAAKITSTDEAGMNTGTSDSVQRNATDRTVVTDRDGVVVDDDMSTNRMQEQAKGVVGQTSDPVIAAENRREAAQHNADNTGRNTRDRNAESLTPMDQSEKSADIAITADIRKRLIADERLSHTAKNIKIITRDGAVSLRGAVATSDEVQLVQEIARSAAGVLSVDSDIEPAR